MSKEFAMLNAARKLESYVSRERYNIDKMKANHRVPESLYVTKAQQFNELLDTLNALYGSLIDGASELFNDHYIQLPQDAEDDDQYDTTDYSVVDDAPVMPAESEVVTLLQTPPVEESQPEPEPEQWQLDGFDSYDAWLALKEVESSEIANDLDMSVSVETSKHKASVALDAYDASKEQDIVDYDVEGDTPPDVLDDEDEDVDDDLVEHDDNDDLVEYDDEYDDPDEDIDDDWDSSDDLVDETSDVDDDDGDDHKRPTEGLEYMHYTQENIRVDNDPIQIASVKTAVEIEGAAGQRGTDIDVDAFSYSEQPRNEFNVDDILGVELDSYKRHTNNDDDNDDDSDTYGGDEDDELASEEYPVVSDYDSEEHYEPEDDSLFANEADNPHADIGDPEYDRVNDDDYDSNDSI